jgi:hypothetical protein
MASKSRPRYGSQVIPAGVQGLRLCRVVPGSKCVFRQTTMEWTGEIRPSDLSRLYCVRIVLRQGRSPKVRVVSPELERLNGKNPPHLYNDWSLCLYHPKTDGFWDGTWVIAETLLPWTAEWLFHYEVWLATGEWTGGGIGHDGSKEAA